MGTSRYFRVEVIALSLVFAQLAYDPHTVLASSEAPQALADLKSTINGLPGFVYAPWVGQLDGLTLYPAVHWVALEDMIRGPIRVAEPFHRELFSRPSAARRPNAYFDESAPCVILLLRWADFQISSSCVTDFGDPF